jgi:hypothetical protein
MRLLVVAFGALIATSSSAKVKMENPLFNDIQKLLELSPATNKKVEAALGIALSERPSEENPHRLIFVSKNQNRAWRNLELRQPRSLGGVSFFLDFEPGKVSRKEIENRFGPAKYPDRETDGEKIFSQSFGTQTLSWVFDKNGLARRVMIQDGR